MARGGSRRVSAWAIMRSYLSKDVLTIDRGTWPGAVAAGVVLIAGMLKAADVVSFASALSSWEWIPARAAGAIAIIVPTIEVGLAVAWFLNVNRVGATRAMLVLIIVFSVAYAAHLLLVGAPECGCLGRLEQYIAIRHAEVFVLGRNGILCVLLMISARQMARHAIGNASGEQ